MEVRRVDLANWVLLTTPKFTTGIKYQLLETQINYRGAAVEVLKYVQSSFHIRDNVKIILLYVYHLIFICKTTLLPQRTTFDYASCTSNSRNFSKGEEILFIKHMRICVIVTEINVLSLFYICHFCLVIKLFKTKTVKNKRLRANFTKHDLSLP